MVSPCVETCSFGMIVIDGKTYMRDLIILPERVIANWRRQDGHNLIPEDIQPIFDINPELLVIGSGVLDRMKVSETVIRKMEQEGIELICLPTGKAWQVYNSRRDKKRVAAAFHLTC